MYAYTLVRCDIGYAVTFLARFASQPSKAHYHALKHLARYLCATKDWGIVYCRGKPLSDFPEVALPKLQESDNLPEFPHSQELCAYVDAAHATDLKTRRSDLLHWLLLKITVNHGNHHAPFLNNKTLNNHGNTICL